MNRTRIQPLPSGYGPRLASRRAAVRAAARAELDALGPEEARLRLQNEFAYRDKHGGPEMLWAIAAAISYGLFNVLTFGFITRTITRSHYARQALILYACLAALMTLCYGISRYEKAKTQHRLVRLLTEALARGKREIPSRLLRFWNVKRIAFAPSAEPEVLIALTDLVQGSLSEPDAHTLDNDFRVKLIDCLRVACHRAPIAFLHRFQRDFSPEEADLLITIGKLVAATGTTMERFQLERIADDPAFGVNRRYVREAARLLLETKLAETLGRAAAMVARTNTPSPTAAPSLQQNTTVFRI